MIMENILIGAVRIRGVRNVKPKIKRAMELLRLKKPNNAIIVKNDPSVIGNLEVSKDYITYGKLSEETAIKMIMKRHHTLKKLSNEEKLEKAKQMLKEFLESNKRIFPYTFRLNPPRKGYKSIKKPYNNGGELGKRDEIDSLLKRMIRD